MAFYVAIGAKVCEEIIRQVLLRTSFTKFSADCFLGFVSMP